MGCRNFEPIRARRGRIMGLYSSIVSGGFAIGPLSLGLVGTQGWPPFLIGSAAFLVCGLIVLAVAPRLPDMPREGEAALSARQRDALNRVREALGLAIGERDPLLVAEALRLSRVALDGLTGRAGTEEMLDGLFGRFCIGK